MDNVTLPSVCVRSRLEQTAVDARAYLNTLGRDAELSTTSMAVALSISRGDVLASLVPARARGELASRLVGAHVMWRIERRS